MIQPTLDSIKAKVEKVFAECQREDYEILYNNAVVDCDEALYELCADPETLTLSVNSSVQPLSSYKHSHAQGVLLFGVAVADWTLQTEDDQFPCYEINELDEKLGKRSAQSASTI
eukprot:21373-Heterococcus_DN1.PRE.2